VRFHHMDTDWGKSLIDAKRDDTQHFDAGFVAKFDKLFAELKQRGIYSVFTMNVHRKFKSGDAVRDHELLAIGKGATYFNPRLIELQYGFTRNFLMHKNPHTGLTYAEEPAILGLEMVNENSLVEAWVGGRLRHGVKDRTDDTWQPIPDSYATELDWLYYDWLQQEGTAEQRATLTAETGVEFASRPEKLPEGFRLMPNLFPKASALRFQAETAFIVGLERKFFENYRALIRNELRCQALLTLSNDHNDSVSGYPHLSTNLRGDWIDGHGYWEHPSIGKITSVKNTPMVNEPLDSTVVQYARSAAAATPFTIGEVNHAFPHRYATEGYPILTAYAQLQGWNGIAWFDWEAGRLQATGKGVRKNGWFDVSNDPVKLAQLTTCALLWHRGDVAMSPETHLRSYDATEVTESLRLWNERPFFKPGFDLTTPLRRATRFTLEAGAKTSALGEPNTPRRPYDRAPSEIVSDTGELSWSHADERLGVVRIDTARSCGVVGFVRNHWWKPGATTRHLAVEPENDHCSILLTSLDDKALAQSSRLLLTATCRSANTGQTWQDDFKTIAEWGDGPMTIVPVAGKVRLKGLEGVKSAKATALSPEGCPVGEAVPLESKDGAWTWKIGVPATTWWAVEIER
jgi:hypothetical protein